jgi:hypothetical protein
VTIPPPLCGAKRDGVPERQRVERALACHGIE